MQADHYIVYKNTSALNSSPAYTHRCVDATHSLHSHRFDCREDINAVFTLSAINAGTDRYIRTCPATSIATLEDKHVSNAQTQCLQNDSLLTLPHTCPCNRFH